MRRTITAVLAVVPLLGAFLLGVQPAQAASDDYCGYQEVCFYTRPDYNWGNGPSRRVDISWLLTKVNGVPMSYWGIDNQLTCVVNNSRGSLSATLIFARYADGTGLAWTVESGGYGICYDGTKYNDLASRVWADRL